MEVAEDLPTAMTLATDDETWKVVDGSHDNKPLQNISVSGCYRRSNRWCCKNVAIIACGIVKGRGLENSRRLLLQGFGRWWN